MSTRIAFLLASLFALVAAAPVAAASNVFNVSGSVTVAEVAWAERNGDRFVGGYLVAAEEKGVKIVEYFYWAEELVQCTGAETPEDPNDDTWSYLVHSEFGYGPAASFKVGKSYGDAVATAFLTIQVDTANQCTGDGTTEILTDVPVRLDVTGQSPLIRESGRGSFHIPGEINARGSFKQVYRVGTGTATIGERSIDGEAAVGEISWRDHINGR